MKYAMAVVTLTISGIYCIAAIENGSFDVFVFGFPAHIAAVFFTIKATK